MKFFPGNIYNPISNVFREIFSMSPCYASNVLMNSFRSLFLLVLFINKLHFLDFFQPQYLYSKLSGVRAVFLQFTVFRGRFNLVRFSCTKTHTYTKPFYGSPEKSDLELIQQFWVTKEAEGFRYLWFRQPVLLFKWFNFRGSLLYDAYNQIFTHCYVCSVHLYSWIRMPGKVDFEILFF